MLESTLEQYQFNSSYGYYEKFTNASQNIAFNPIIEGVFYKRELILQTSYPTSGTYTINVRIFNSLIYYPSKVNIFYGKTKILIFLVLKHIHLFQIYNKRASSFLQSNMLFKTILCSKSN